VKQAAIMRWVLVMLLGSGAAVGAMMVMKDAAKPQGPQAVAQAPAKSNVVARATQMDKIERALRGE